MKPNSRFLLTDNSQTVLLFLGLIILTVSTCSRVEEVNEQEYSYTVYVGDKNRILDADLARGSEKHVMRSDSKVIKSLSDETIYNIYNTDDSGRGWMYQIENGEVVVAAEVSNEENNGNYYTYYENGRVRSIGEYLRGKKNGNWFQFYQNGMQINYGSYDSGDRIGNWFYYDTLKLQREVRTYSTPESYKSSWYDDQDRIISVGQIVDGKEHGRYLEYDSLGRVQFDVSYYYGALHDTSRIYKNGNLIVYLIYDYGELIEEVKVN